MTTSTIQLSIQAILLAYGFIGVFVLGAEVASETQENPPDPFWPVVVALVWPLYVSALALVGFKVESKIWD
jgi:hypothetical protein